MSGGAIALINSLGGLGSFAGAYLESCIGIVLVRTVTVVRMFSTTDK